MSKVKCAAGLDSLNVREMVDVPEIDIDKMEDKEVTERFRREWKAAQYADLKGRRFRPTFSSNIDFFEIRGYDSERDMVLTTAHPKGGSAFDDEIEERYLAGAFETGEYVALPMAAQPGETVHVLTNPYATILGSVNRSRIISAERRGDTSPSRVASWPAGKSIAKT